jgi:sulfur relay protein TusB/DsrH
MAVLHIINHTDALADCLGVAHADDVVLLIEDGVYAGSINDVERAMCAIDVDVRARGLGKRMNAEVALVSYADFVKLTVAHNPIVTWR